MKKVAIALFIVLCVFFAGRCYYESQRPPELSHMETIEDKVAQTRNKQIALYSGVKVRGSSVKALFNVVETLNEQQVFPINMRYGEVSSDSYDWSTQTTQNLNSGDSIRDSSYYEVVMQDQLPENNVDGYLDTITIRSYTTYTPPTTTTNSTLNSGE